MSDRRLRVLTISDLFPDPTRPWLGAFVANQVRYLQALCEQVVVVPLRVFPHRRLWQRASAPGQLVQAWRTWRHDLTQIPDNTVMHGSVVRYVRYTSPPRQLYPGVCGFFAYGFLLASLRRLHREQRFDLIHAHYASPAGVIALLARRWMRVPVVVSIHGADLTHTVRHDPISASIVRWVLRNADAVLANSTWTAERVQQLRGHGNAVYVVRLGAETPSPLPNVSEHAAAEPLRLLSVAHLEQRKGHAVLLDALHALRGLGYAFRCRIVGDGPCRAALVAQAARLGIDDLVSFEGLQPMAAVWQYYADCDLFVLPSWDEAFGLVYIEALSMAKPVIGCEGEGGPGDLRALGDCIELARARDVDSLVSALRRLLDNPERRRQLGETGCRIVQLHYSWPRNAAQTLEIYRELLLLDKKP